MTDELSYESLSVVGGRGCPSREVRTDAKASGGKNKGAIANVQAFDRQIEVIFDCISLTGRDTSSQTSKTWRRMRALPSFPANSIVKTTMRNTHAGIVILLRVVLSKAFSWNARMPNEKRKR